MLLKGEAGEKLVKTGLVIGQDQILTVVFLLEFFYFQTVEPANEGGQNKPQHRYHHFMMGLDPLFCSLLFLCHCFLPV